MDYYKYIVSKRWKSKSYKFMSNVGFKCEECGSSNNLTCHHLTYKNLGNETKRDICVLCWNCHKERHKRHHNKIEPVKSKAQIEYDKKKLELIKKFSANAPYKPTKSRNTTGKKRRKNKTKSNKVKIPSKKKQREKK